MKLVNLESLVRCCERGNAVVDVDKMCQGESRLNVLMCLLFPSQAHSSISLFLYTELYTQKTARGDFMIN